MRIYLLNPPYLPHFGRGARWQDTGRGGTLYYPIWLAYATAFLELENTTRLVDAPARGWDEVKVLEDIQLYNPKMVVIDSSFPSLRNDLRVAENIKREVPDSIIVLVGPPASQCPENILQSPGIDIVARWEYDMTLFEVARTLQEGSSFGRVVGISFRDNGKIVHNTDREFTTSEILDTIPFVSKVYQKHLNIKNYFLGQCLYPEIQIFTGRGCPNQCTFCSWPQTLMGRRYRVRSVQNVIEEVEWIQNNLPVKEIFFEDDTFTIDKTRVREFCEAYQQRGLSIPWSCNARVDTLDLGLMKGMKKANCRLLVSGFESGSDIILKNIKKGFDTNQIQSFSRNAKKARLLVHGDFIVGLPGETKETIDQTIQLIWQIKPDILQIAVASPFPGTEFYEWCKIHHYLITENLVEYLDQNGHQRAIISYPGLTNIEMEELADKILKKYYLSLTYFPIALNQIIRKNSLDEIKRMIYSVKMFLNYLGGRDTT